MTSARNHNVERVICMPNPSIDILQCYRSDDYIAYLKYLEARQMAASLGFNMRHIQSRLARGVILHTSSNLNAKTLWGYPALRPISVFSWPIRFSFCPKEGAVRFKGKSNC